MRSIPTTKSTTTSSLSPSPSSSTAPSSSLTSSDMHSTTWHSPIPYLFGGLAAMLGLIAFALLILACSYWKLSVQHDDEETGNNNNRNMEGKEHGDSSDKGTVKVYEEKILVIMAGDEKPTFLATPACAKCSSLTDDGVGNHSDKDIKNHDKTSEKSEKEMNNNSSNNQLVLQATTLLSTQQPQPQETAQQQNQLQ